MSAGDPERRGVAPGTVFVLGFFTIGAWLAVVGAFTVTRWALETLPPLLVSMFHG